MNIAMKTPTITPDEIKRRKDAVAYATASIELEGFTPSQFAQELDQQYIRGEISLEQMHEALIDHYK